MAKKLYEVVAVSFGPGCPAPVTVQVVPPTKRKDAEERAYEMEEAMLRQPVGETITSYVARPVGG